MMARFAVRMVGQKKKTRKTKEEEKVGRRSQMPALDEIEGFYLRVGR